MTDPGHSIWISNRQRVVVDEGDLVDLAAEVLSGEGVADVELSVSLVDDDEMESLHVRYMNEPGPTDVLSFAQDEEKGRPGLFLGDVVIE